MNCLRRHPETASWDGDAIERILLLAKVEEGIKQADAERTVPHEEVKQRFARWRASSIARARTRRIS
jgi:predicted transcriptional regulator